MQRLFTFKCFDAAVHQLDKGLTQYDVVHSTYLNIVQGLDLCKPIIVVHTHFLYILDLLSQLNRSSLLLVR